MERIVYNKTLDAHKTGVQFTLYGFETADKMSRRIVLSLMASGDTIDLPLEQLEAVMYVTTPGIEETSINKCTINGNTVIYDSLPITEEGETIMQLKLIETRPGGVNSVLMSPKFAVEVIKSDAEDESIKGTASYTAVEEALAKAKDAYDSRLLRIALNYDCMFYAYYADGTVYESDVLKELFLKGDALISQSYARGGTGVRDGEDTDNSMYYSNVSKSMALETKKEGENALEILAEAKKHGVYTAFSADFETGELIYESPKYDFEVDKETGELKIKGLTYNIEDNMVYVIREWLKGFDVTFPDFNEKVDTTYDQAIETRDNLRVLGETVEEQGDDIEGLKGTVLWTNPNANVEFPSQTINLDLSDYFRFTLIVKSSDNRGAYYEQTISQKDLSFPVFCNPLGAWESRLFTVTDSGLYVGESPAGRGYYVIPYKLIGYKFK